MQTEISLHFSITYKLHISNTAQQILTKFVSFTFSGKLFEISLPEHEYELNEILPRKIYNYKPKRKSRSGRQRARWTDCVEKDPKSSSTEVRRMKIWTTEEDSKRNSKRQR